MFSLPRWICSGGLGLWLIAAPVHAQTVVDALGRSVTIPDHPQRVLGAAPPLTALLLALDPQQVLALNMPFSPEAASYLPTTVMQLPVVGSTMDHGTVMNAETILALKPDLALAWGGTPGAAAEEPTLRFFSQIGVPVVFIRLETLNDWPTAFETVGALIGEPARGQQIAALIRTSQQQLAAALADIPKAQRVRVYYAEGADGLATECDQSFHIEAIALAGGDIVHRCEQRSMMGMEKVSLEQVIGYDPQFIVVQDAQALGRMSASPAWQRVQAVRAGHVLVVPTAPMNWIDRPPSFTRALGAQWLAHAFYPQRVPDIHDAIRTFYHTVWQVTLTDSDIDHLLGQTASVPQHSGSMQ